MASLLWPDCRAIAMDLDGTLAERRKVSPRAMDCLQGARGAGMLLFLITSRFASEMEDIGVALRLFDDIVTENGAIHAASTTCLPHDLGFGFSAEALDVLEQLQIEDFRKGEAIFKGRAKDRETAVAALSGLPGEPLVAVNRDDLLVLPPDVDKGAAIRHIAAVRGLVMTELIAVGDGEVDAPMLRAAGMSFAPHDATETATAAATVVLKRCGAQATCDLLDRLAAANH